MNDTVKTGMCPHLEKASNRLAEREHCLSRIATLLDVHPFQAGMQYGSLAIDQLELIYQELVSQELWMLNRIAADAAEGT